jgi:hypothetical protein
MQEMSTKVQVDWRRRQVFEQSSKGYSQAEIARRLQIPEYTISRDLDYLRERAKENIRKYVDERLPEEYEKCLIGLTAIQKEAWTAAERTEDTREKIQALSLAKECYGMKLELLTNATVVDDAIRFVSAHVKNTSHENYKTEIDTKEVKIEVTDEKEQTDDNTSTSYNSTF